jgi:hypothetical protein
VTVTTISVEFVDSPVKTAAGVDTIEVAQDVTLPRLTLAFDQLLVQLTFQSWVGLDDGLQRLLEELEEAKRRSNYEAAREQDVDDGGVIQTMYCHHSECKQDREVLRSWEECNAASGWKTLAVELECRHVRRLRTFAH